MADTSMTTAQPAQQLQENSFVTLQLQAGQAYNRESGIWVSYAPDVSTVAEGDTQNASLSNLCEQIEDFCNFLQQTGRPPFFRNIPLAEPLQS